MTEWLTPPVASVLVPIVTFFFGWFSSRFTMSKKERRDFEQVLFQNGKDLMSATHDRYLEYSSAISEYVRSDDAGFDQFVKISTTGERYLYQLQIAADAILTGKVSQILRDETLVPKLKEASETTLPRHYQALKNIAERKNFHYTGELKRENYAAIYSCVEKFARPSPSADVAVEAASAR